MINFVLAGNKIRFEINDDAAKEGGIENQFEAAEPSAPAGALAPPVSSARS